MSSATAAALQRCPFLDGLQPKHLDRLARLASHAHFAKDELIFREGQEHPVFYVLLSGRVQLEGDHQGRTYCIQTLYTGDEFGWSAVLGRRKTFRARALEPVEALAFDACDLHEACRTDPYFGCAFFERMFQLVAERLQETRIELLQARAAPTGSDRRV